MMEDELRTGCGHWLPAYGFHLNINKQFFHHEEHKDEDPEEEEEMEDSFLRNNIARRRDGEIGNNLDDGHLGSTEYVYLETIQEETSDDLRSENSDDDISSETTGGWLATDSESGSVIRIQAIIIDDDDDDCESDREVACPAKRRRQDCQQPPPSTTLSVNCHCQNNDTDCDYYDCDCQSSSLSRSSSLLQFENLEKQILEDNNNMSSVSISPSQSLYSHDSLDRRLTLTSAVSPDSLDNGDDSLRRRTRRKKRKTAHCISVKFGTDSNQEEEEFEPQERTYRSFDSSDSSSDSSSSSLSLDGNEKNNRDYYARLKIDLPVIRRNSTTNNLRTWRSCDGLQHLQQQSQKPSFSVENLSSEDSGFGGEMRTSSIPNMMIVVQQESVYPDREPQSLYTTKVQIGDWAFKAYDGNVHPQITTHHHGNGKQQNQHQQSVFLGNFGVSYHDLTSVEDASSTGSGLGLVERFLRNTKKQNRNNRLNSTSIGTSIGNKKSRENLGSTNISTGTGRDGDNHGTTGTGIGTTTNRTESSTSTGRGNHSESDYIGTTGTNSNTNRYIQSRLDIANSTTNRDNHSRSDSSSTTYANSTTDRDNLSRSDNSSTTCANSTKNRDNRSRLESSSSTRATSSTNRDIESKLDYISTNSSTNRDVQSTLDYISSNGRTNRDNHSGSTTGANNSTSRDNISTNRSTNRNNDGGLDNTDDNSSTKRDDHSRLDYIRVNSSTNRDNHSGSTIDANNSTNSDNYISTSSITNRDNDGALDSTGANSSSNTTTISSTNFGSWLNCIGTTTTTTDSTGVDKIRENHVNSTTKSISRDGLNRTGITTGRGDFGTGTNTQSTVGSSTAGVNTSTNDDRHTSTRKSGDNPSRRDCIGTARSTAGSTDAGGDNSSWRERRVGNICVVVDVLNAESALASEASRHFEKETASMFRRRSSSEPNLLNACDDSNVNFTNFNIHEEVLSGEKNNANRKIPRDYQARTSGGGKLAFQSDVEQAKELLNNKNDNTKRNNRVDYQSGRPAGGKLPFHRDGQVLNNEKNSNLSEEEGIELEEKRLLTNNLTEEEEEVEENNKSKKRSRVKREVDGVDRDEGDEEEVLNDSSRGDFGVVLVLNDDNKNNKSKNKDLLIEEVKEEVEGGKMPKLSRYQRAQYGDKITIPLTGDLSSCGSSSEAESNKTPNKGINYNKPQHAVVVSAHFKREGSYAEAMANSIDMSSEDELQLKQKHNDKISTLKAISEQSIKSADNDDEELFTSSTTLVMMRNRNVVSTPDLAKLQYRKSSLINRADSTCTLTPAKSYTGSTTSKGVTFSPVVDEVNWRDDTSASNSNRSSSYSLSSTTPDRETPPLRPRKFKNNKILSSPLFKNKKMSSSHPELEIDKMQRKNKRRSDADVDDEMEGGFGWRNSCALMTSDERNKEFAQDNQEEEFQNDAENRGGTAGKRRPADDNSGGINKPPQHLRETARTVRSPPSPPPPPPLLLSSGSVRMSTSPRTHHSANKSASSISVNNNKNSSTNYSSSSVSLDGGASCGKNSVDDVVSGVKNKNKMIMMSSSSSGNNNSVKNSAVDDNVVSGNNTSGNKGRLLGGFFSRLAGFRFPSTRRRNKKKESVVLAGSDKSNDGKERTGGIYNSGQRVASKEDYIYIPLKVKQDNDDNDNDENKTPTKRLYSSQPAFHNSNTDSDDDHDDDVRVRNEVKGKPPLPRVISMTPCANKTTPYGRNTVDSARRRLDNTTNTTRFIDSRTSNQTQPPRPNAPTRSIKNNSRRSSSNRSVNKNHMEEENQTVIVSKNKHQQYEEAYHHHNHQNEDEEDSVLLKRHHHHHRQQQQHQEDEDVEEKVLRYYNQDREDVAKYHQYQQEEEEEVLDCEKRGFLRQQQQQKLQPMGLIETDLDTEVTVITSSPSVTNGSVKNNLSINSHHNNHISVKSGNNSGVKTRSLLDLESDQDIQHLHCGVDDRLNQRRPHKSMEFLLDKQNLRVVEPPENELKKNLTSAASTTYSEHQLRVQRSLQKLDLPDWYTHNKPSTTFLINSKKQQTSRHGTTFVTNSNSSISTEGINNNNYVNNAVNAAVKAPATVVLGYGCYGYSGGALSPSTAIGGYQQPFVRWSTSRLNASSTASSPCASTRSSFNVRHSNTLSSPTASLRSGPGGVGGSFNYRQPYMGWRSQERLSRTPRTPAERLANSILQHQQQHQQNHQQQQQENNPEIQTSIKEVTSAIVHYVSGLKPDDNDFDTDSTCQQQQRSPRGSSQRLCWLESSFVGTRPLDSPQTPVALTSSQTECAVLPTTPPLSSVVTANSLRLELNKSYNTANDRRSRSTNRSTADGGGCDLPKATLEDVLDSLLGLQPSTGYTSFSNSTSTAMFD